MTGTKSGFAICLYLIKIYICVKNCSHSVRRRSLTLNKQIIFLTQSTDPLSSKKECIKYQSMPTQKTKLILINKLIYRKGHIPILRTMSPLTRPHQNFSLFVRGPRHDRQRHFQTAIASTTFRSLSHKKGLLSDLSIHDQFAFLPLQL